MADQVVPTSSAYEMNSQTDSAPTAAPQNAASPPAASSSGSLPNNNTNNTSNTNDANQQQQSVPANEVAASATSSGGGTDDNTATTSISTTAEPDNDALANALGMSTSSFDGHLIVKVPAADVGRIIGRNGQNIHELQELTGARISLSTDPADGDVRRVRITGTREQVQHCHVRLQLKITPREQVARIKALQQEARKYEEPPSKAVVNISTVHIGRVIGKRGQTIQHLQELSGAHIELPKEYSKEESFRTLTITGTSQQVARCQELIELFSTEPNIDIRPPTHGHFPMSLTVLIPNKHVGRVIGKKGAHIKDIQEHSGAVIHLPKTSRYGSDSRELCIFGTAEAIVRCQELLHATMAPSEHELQMLQQQQQQQQHQHPMQQQQQQQQQQHPQAGEPHMIVPQGSPGWAAHTAVPAYGVFTQAAAYPYDMSYPMFVPQMQMQEYDAYVPVNPAFGTPPYSAQPFVYSGQMPFSPATTQYMAGSPAFGRRGPPPTADHGHMTP